MVITDVGLGDPDEPTAVVPDVVVAVAEVCNLL